MTKCDLCNGTGYYTFGGSFGGPTSTQKCWCDTQVWVCNACDFPNYTQSISQEEIDKELLSCINCGGFEFHLKII